MRAAIEAALLQTKGEVRKAALLLGVNERTVWRHIKRYGVRRVGLESPVRKSEVDKPKTRNADKLIDELLAEEE